MCQFLQPSLGCLFLRSNFRNENHDDLFLSWTSKKPMTKVSLTSWLKTVLPSSGINTKVFFCSLIQRLTQKFFSAHSYRGASLSSSYNKGVSLNNIFESCRLVTCRYVLKPLLYPFF